jgi:hypothetical protein
MAHDVMHTDLAGHRNGSIRRAVVHDQNLDHVDALDAPRDAAHQRRKRALLVVTGDLDDQLHGSGPVSPYRRLYFLT